ncbi:MAG: hypothetical protein E7309_15710 [Butyrivibrio sp.]|jgi:hypothetical protein|nr:hypothetical protein [Butyrivibrio sp.]
MKLHITSDVVEARKINEQNYVDYDEIIIVADEIIVDDRSRNILKKLPFSITADEYRNGDEENDSNVITQNINGQMDIDPNTNPQEGTILNINGVLKIKEGSEEVIKKYKRITVNGMILLPKSISSNLPYSNMSINGVSKVYPDGYTLLDNNYGLDKYFPMRSKQDAGYFAAKSIIDMNQETDFGMLVSKNVKLSTDKFYIRKCHLEAGLQVINIEAKIEEVPDNVTIVRFDDCEVLTESMVNTYGSDLYIIGDIMINAESGAVLDKLSSLYVDGTVRADKEHARAFNDMGAQCKKLIVMRMHTISDHAVLNVDKELLLANEQGVKITDCALVKIAADIPADMILQRLQLSDIAKINCSPEQRSAVVSVSSDVALVSTDGSGIGGIFRSIFERPVSVGSPELEDSETKYVTADYYEL